MREHAADPRDYEMMLVVAPTVAEEGLPAVVERVSGYIATHGGTVDSTNHENPWGRRRLAYEINDHRDAFYVLYRFHAQAEAIVEIERELKLDEQVIRHLVVRYDEMTEHEERPPRGQASGDGAPGAPFRRSQATATAAQPGESADSPSAESSAASEDAASEATADAETEAAASAAAASDDADGASDTAEAGDEDES